MDLKIIFRQAQYKCFGKLNTSVSYLSLRSTIISKRKREKKRLESRKKRKKKAHFSGIG
jgi:hypothetical protein